MRRNNANATKDGTKLPLHNFCVPGNQSYLPTTVVVPSSFFFFFYVVLTPPLSLLLPFRRRHRFNTQLHSTLPTLFQSTSQFLDGKLAQLQNMIKRDPGAYLEEFEQQHRHFLSELAIFQLEPSKAAGHFGEVVSFLSHVAPCYKEQLKEFPTQISSLLSEHYLTLERKLREVMVRALILMRNRGLFEPLPLLKLCFLLFRCPDKELRQLLYKFIVSDVRSMNKTSLNHRLNTDLQNFLYTMLDDASVVAARKSLDVIVELYRRRIWTGPRTVNAVASVCLSKRSTLSRTAVRFFLGIDHLIDADQDEEDDEDKQIVAHAKILSERTGSVSKKTRSSKRKKAKQIKKAKKIQQKQNAEDQRLDDPRWPAIDLLHDPQGFSDKLYRRLRTSNEQFEVRMLFMNLLSRVIGRNQCICLNFYQFMTRYMQPSQRDVTKMMAYIVQGCHELVPPDELKTLIRTIANNFVTDRCSGEVIAVGLNGMSFTVISHFSIQSANNCVRCPLLVLLTHLFSFCCVFRYS